MRFAISSTLIVCAVVLSSRNTASSLRARSGVSAWIVGAVPIGVVKVFGEEDIPFRYGGLRRESLHRPQEREPWNSAITIPRCGFGLAKRLVKPN
jgi:hypothetical protein